MFHIFMIDNLRSYYFDLVNIIIWASCTVGLCSKVDSKYSETLYLLTNDT